MCRWRPSFSSVAFVFIFLFLADCGARPSHEPATKDISIRTRNIIHDSSNAPSLSPSWRTPRSLQMRGDGEDAGHQSFISLGSGWNLYYSSWSSSILPVQPAAWALRQLYTNVATNAGTIWRLSPPRHYLPLAIGNVMLLIECHEEPIPWALVQAFGRLMLAKVDGGWTGLYEMLFSNAKNDVTISVILKVVGR